MSEPSHAASKSRPLAPAKTSSEEDRMEELIKHGEMTPFGTVIDFDKGCSLEKPNKSLNQAAKPTGKNAPKKKIDNKSNTNDFDSFLLEFDTQLINAAKVKKPVVKQAPKPVAKIVEAPSSKSVPNKKAPEKTALNSSYVESHLTEFDMFLSEFDKPKTSKQANQQTNVKQAAKNDKNNNNIVAKSASKSVSSIGSAKK